MTTTNHRLQQGGEVSIVECSNPSYNGEYRDVAFLSGAEFTAFSAEPLRTTSRIQSGHYSSPLVTISTQTNHDLINGCGAIISGCSNSSYNGYYTSVTFISKTQFTAQPDGFTPSGDAVNGSATAAPVGAANDGTVKGRQIGVFIEGYMNALHCCTIERVGVTKRISNGVWASGKITFTTIEDHHLTSGDSASIQLCVNNNYNGTYKNIRMLSSTEFEVDHPDNPGGWVDSPSSNAIVVIGKRCIGIYIKSYQWRRNELTQIPDNSFSPTMISGCYTESFERTVILDGAKSVTIISALISDFDAIPAILARKGSEIGNSGNLVIGRLNLNLPFPPIIGQLGNLDVAGTSLVNGNYANLDPAGGVDLSILQNSANMLIGWNRTAGEGEADFIANRGAGSIGGFGFYDYDNSGNLTPLVRIKGDGNLGVGVERFGSNAQKVFSIGIGTAPSSYPPSPDSNACQIWSDSRGKQDFCWPVFMHYDQNKPPEVRVLVGIGGIATATGSPGTINMDHDFGTTPKPNDGWLSINDYDGTEVYIPYWKSK